MEVNKNRLKRPAASTIVFAVLFAITLTSTIVLAAFSANKSASATISFANGVKLMVTGATNSGTADTLSVSATLKWTIIKGTTNDTTGSVTNEVGDNNIKLAKISITAGGYAGSVYVAVKPTVSYSGTSTGTVTVTPASGWTAGSDGYYLKTYTATVAGVAADFTSADIAIYTVGEDTANNFAGRTYTANLFVEASTSPIRTAS